MSASDRLRALESSMEDYSGPDYKDAFYAHIRYRDALPQIVAVVEAAEWAESVLVAPMPEGWGPGERDLRAALAALDEALGPRSNG